jgi:hypothetical protein
MTFHDCFGDPILLMCKFIHYIHFMSLDYQSNSLISPTSQTFTISTSCSFNPVQHEAPWGYNTCKYYHFATSPRCQNPNLGSFELNPFNLKFGHLRLDPLLKSTLCFTTTEGCVCYRHDDLSHYHNTRSRLAVWSNFQLIKSIWVSWPYLQYQTQANDEMDTEVFSFKNRHASILIT